MDQLNELRMQYHERTMRQMVAEIHQGKLNIGQAAAKFEVNRKTVSHWLDKVEQEGEGNTRHLLSQESPKVSSQRRSKPQKPDVVELEARISSLQRELEAAQFKALYYSTLVRVAEQELGMDIEKKRPPQHLAQIAAKFFSAGEAAQIEAAPNEQAQAEVFSRFWSGKEALIKAVGGGVFKNIHEVRIAAPSWKIQQLPAQFGDLSRWRLDFYEEADGYICSVAFKSGGPS